MSPASRRHAPDPVAVTKHRDDVQGLRAVAVLLVVLGHAGIGFLKGGFVGVDVFFVLSGFLITGLLVSGASKRGCVSFTDFYVRRARRILPAAALTLVATEIVAYQLLNPVRAKQSILDSFAASLFVANIHFARQGIDYFAQGQPPSPVQHFWSLAVEEQFYLVWPALLSLVVFGVALGGRSRRRAPMVTEPAIRRLLVVVVVAGIASLGWSVHYTSVLPAAAYFSTFARAWELALGAGLAIGTSKLIGISPVSRFVMGWSGLIAIAGAAVRFSSSTPFPGYAALLPTMGAALVIGAGVGDQPRLGVGRLLALGPFRYVGDRSYAFYLWHWPVLVIAVEYEGHELSVGVKLLLLVGAFLLSILTYGLFENPIRRAQWSPPATAALGLCAIAVVVLVAAHSLETIYTKTSAVGLTPAALGSAVLGNPQQVAKANDAESKQAVAATGAGQALPAVVAAVKAAQRGAKLPQDLTPPALELLSGQYLYSFPYGCAPVSDSETTSKICRLGDASGVKSIVVMGDSHAQMWMPTILSMAQLDGWVVLPLIKSGCEPDKWFDRAHAKCGAWYRWAVGQAKALHPNVTLIGGCCGGGTGTSAEAYENGLTSLASTMERFSKSGVVVVADDVGVSQQPVDCLLARHATMRRCTTRWTEERFYVNDDMAALAKRHGFDFLDTRGWFCFEDQCPMVVGRTIVYRDTGHITKPYALELAEPFRAAFREAIAHAKAQ